jgi:predicted Holliday junction resolvase-like endonuclease
MVEKPQTQKEQIDQLWWTILGNNGDGLIVIVKGLREELHALRDTVDEYRREQQRFDDTRFQTCPTKEWLEEQREERRRKSRRKIDVRLVIYGLVVGLIASVPSFLMVLGIGG